MSLERWSTADPQVVFEESGARSVEHARQIVADSIRREMALRVGPVAMSMGGGLRVALGREYLIWSVALAPYFFQISVDVKYHWDRFRPLPFYVVRWKGNLLGRLWVRIVGRFVRRVVLGG